MYFYNIIIYFINRISRLNIFISVFSLEKTLDWGVLDRQIAQRKLSFLFMDKFLVHPVFHFYYIFFQQIIQMQD